MPTIGNEVPSTRSSMCGPLTATEEIGFRADSVPLLRGSNRRFRGGQSGTCGERAILRGARLSAFFFATHHPRLSRISEQAASPSYRQVYCQSRITLRAMVIKICGIPLRLGANRRVRCLTHYRGVRRVRRLGGESFLPERVSTWSSFARAGAGIGSVAGQFVPNATAGAKDEQFWSDDKICTS